MSGPVSTAMAAEAVVVITIIIGAAIYDGIVRAVLEAKGIEP